jgi:hypothetical protein
MARFRHKLHITPIHSLSEAPWGLLLFFLSGGSLAVFVISNVILQETFPALQAFWRSWPGFAKLTVLDWVRLLNISYAFAFFGLFWALALVASTASLDVLKTRFIGNTNK